MEILKELFPVSTDKVTIKVSGLTISLCDMSKEQISQFTQRIKNYDLSDIGTLISLIEWCRGRGIKVKVRSHWWRLRGLAFAILIYLYNNTEVGKKIITPKKW